MTKPQAEALADWVQCCALLQQMGEHYIESLDTSHEPLHVSRILLISVSALIAAKSFNDATKANIEERGLLIFHALRKSLEKSLTDIATSHGSHHTDPPTP